MMTFFLQGDPPKLFLMLGKLELEGLPALTNELGVDIVLAQEEHTPWIEEVFATGDGEAIERYLCREKNDMDQWWAPGVPRMVDYEREGVKLANFRDTWKGRQAVLRGIYTMGPKFANYADSLCLVGKTKRIKGEWCVTLTTPYEADELIRALVHLRYQIWPKE